MASSVVYSSVFAAVLASLRSLGTSLVVFDRRSCARCRHRVRQAGGETLAMAIAGNVIRAELNPVGARLVLRLRGGAGTTTRFVPT